MAYAVQADLNIDAQRLVELTDNASAPNIIDTTLLATLETQSEGIVNAVLSGTGLVPFGTPPPIITFITASIWAKRIYRHREIIDIPSTIMDDDKLAWELMQQIIDGSIDLTPSAPLFQGLPEVESSPPRGWTIRDLVT